MDDDFRDDLYQMLVNFWNGDADEDTTSAAIEGLCADALRDAADRLPALTEGTDRAGTATWRKRDRDAYSLAIEEAQAALRSLANRNRD